MKQTLKRLYNTFHILVTVYAAVLIVGSGTQLVYGQEIRDYRLENLESRMSALDALKLDQRLTRIETILASLQEDYHGSWVNNAANGGVGLLLLRAVFLEVKKKRGTTE